MATRFPWLTGRPRALARALTPDFFLREARTRGIARTGASQLPQQPSPTTADQTHLEPDPKPTRNATRANELIDAALIELAKSNVAGASEIMTEAEAITPALRVPTHFYLYDTYYRIDKGAPLDPDDVVAARASHARILIEAAKNIAGSLGGGHLAFWTYYEQYLEQQRQFPKKVTPFGHRSFSVSNDDGIIQEIFKRIGTTNRYFVEFGINDGAQTNTTALLYQGWQGLWMEASSCYHTMAQYLFRDFISSGALRTACRFMTAENVNSAIRRHIHTKDTEIDLLSIDVDGNDYWIWKAVDCVNPRAVVVEYNSYFHPPVAIAQRYEPLKIFNGTSYYGASLEAISRAADAKGYKLVACSLVGDNAFYVRDDLVGDKFYKPGDTLAHFEPNRGTGFPWCHVPGRGDWDMVEPL